jgi:CheY-like chemotaxis protein
MSCSSSGGYGGGSGQEAARPRIVLIDDEPDVRETISEVLLASGHAVSAYASGEDALADAAGTAGARLLIADIMLGSGMDGIAAAELLRARLDDPRVIYISGHFRSVRIPPLRPLDRMLRKPFGVTELLDALGPLSSDPN